MIFEEDYDYIIEKLDSIQKEVEFLKQTLQHKADKQRAITEIENAEDDIMDIYEKIKHEKSHKRCKYPNTCWF